VGEIAQSVYHALCKQGKFLDLRRVFDFGDSVPNQGDDPTTLRVIRSLLDRSRPGIVLGVDSEAGVLELSRVELSYSFQGRVRTFSNPHIVNVSDDTPPFLVLSEDNLRSVIVGAEEIHGQLGNESGESYLRAGILD